MSRTYKDKPSKLRFPEDQYGYGRILGLDYRWIELPGVKPKLKRSHCHWQWLENEPSYWIRQMMTRPQRRKCRLWEAKVKYMVDLEEADCPFFKNKPHKYYW